MAYSLLSAKKKKPPTLGVLPKELLDMAGEAQNAPMDENPISMGITPPMPKQAMKVPGGMILPDGTAVLDDVVATGASAPVKKAAVVAPAPAQMAAIAQDAGMIDNEAEQISEMTSGTKETSSVEDRDEQLAKNVDESVKYAPIDEYAQRLQGLYETPGVKQLSKGLDDQSAYLDNLIQSEQDRGVPVDVRSIAAWTDGEFGTKYASALDKPENRSEMIRALLNAKDRLQDNRKDLSKSLLETAKGQETGKTSVVQQLLEVLKRQNGIEDTTGTKDVTKESQINPKVLDMRAKAAASRSGQSDLRIKEKYVRDDLNKITNPLADRVDQLSLAYEAIERGDWQSLTSMLTILARNVGEEKGVITDRDAANYMPQTLGGDLTKLESYITSNPSVKTDPKFTAGIRKLLKQAVNNTLTNYEGRADRVVKQYKNSRSYGDVDVDAISAPALEAIKKLRKFGGTGKSEKPISKVIEGGKKKNKVPGVSAKSKDELMNMSDEEFDKLYKSSMGSK